MTIEKHPFQPFLPSGTRILFLGSFPPQAKRWCMDFYYPNWINDFWRIMGLIHYGDKEKFCVKGEKRFDLDAIIDFCTSNGLGFYDTASEVRRLKDNASDAFLEVVVPTDVAGLMDRIPSCGNLVATGQKSSEIIAAQLGCDLPAVGDFVRVSLPGTGRDIRFWRMPSSSRAYPLPLAEKAGSYRKLFETL